MRIDLNCDMGESFGVYRLGADEALMPLITSANVACGFHAGAPLVLDRTVRLAKAHAVTVGAHPGYPDLAGFGRRDMALAPAEIERATLYQVGALAAFCRAHGLPLVHVKAHGAPTTPPRGIRPARAIARGIARFDPGLIMVGLASSQVMAEAAAGEGLRFAREAGKPARRRRAPSRRRRFSTAEKTGPTWRNWRRDRGSRPRKSYAFTAASSTPCICLASRPVFPTWASCPRRLPRRACPRRAPLSQPVQSASPAARRASTRRPHREAGA